jgi:hypothetical protein
MKKGYQPRTRIVKDEKGDLVADSHSIMARWRNYWGFIRLQTANSKYNSLSGRLICRKIPSYARKYKKFKTYLHTSSEFRTNEPKIIYYYIG